EAAHRPGALLDQPGRGRPRIGADDVPGLLRRALEQPPDAWGYQAVDWTVPLLCAFVAERGGATLSEDTVRRRLHELGYVWKRSRYVLPPDPEREKKTADLPPRAAVARAGRRLGRGRNGPAAVPAPAGALGRARRTGAGADQRRQRQARRVRGPQPAHGHAAAAGAAAPVRG